MLDWIHHSSSVETENCGHKTAKQVERAKQF